MRRQDILTLLRGANLKAFRLQTMVKTNLNADGTFDTEEHRKEAIALIDEIDELLKTVERNLP